MTDSQLLDKALDYIVDLSDGSDNICEQMGDDWCEKHCGSNTSPDRQYVLRFLKEIYK